MHRRIDELSKGFRQRVGLAASMLHDPECLILDEPTTGLDPNQIVEIRQLIRRLGEKKTVLLSSHVLPEVEAACDRMMIIDKGRLVALGTAQELSVQSQGGSMLHLEVKSGARALAKALEKEIPGLEASVGKGKAPQVVDLCHPDPGMALAEAAFHAAVKCNAVIVEMRRSQASLEDVFRELTGGAS
jgi:ABC-2 type transport system ATP-binding protein